MAPLTVSQQDQLTQKVHQIMLGTPYPCSVLVPLDGGTTSFVFRGSLTNPLHLERDICTATVIVKHATDAASCNQDFALDGSRSEFEYVILQALQDFIPRGSISATSVKTPRALYFVVESRVQVIEYISGSISLGSLIALRNTNSIPASLTLESVGFALGFWLREFHVWASAPGQTNLRRRILQNQPMRDLKRRITYDTIVDILENFPELFASSCETLEEVKDMITPEFDQEIDRPIDGREAWGIIHGDFWTGNVLFANHPFHESGPSKENSFCVIDWEFTQFGHRSVDLGQMIGDLLEQNHFNPTGGFVNVVEGLVKGYGMLADDMGFRIAIHVGVHMINWYSRHVRPHESAPTEAEMLMVDAVSFVVRGWKKDKKWFEGTALNCLFASK